MIRLLLLIGLVCSLSILHAQEIEFVTAKWSDSFREWLFLDIDEEEIGGMKIKWDLNDDFSEWVFELNDMYGQIKTKWRGDYSQWDMIIDGEYISARPVFPGDASRWKITYDGSYYTLLHDYGWQWSVEDTNFKVMPTYNGDPRDWILQGDYGQLDKPLEIFTIFLSIFNSLPLFR